MTDKRKNQFPKIFCAVDTPDLAAAQEMARRIAPITGGIKLGLEFFNANGPDGVAAVMRACPADTALFLDLKFHDIPNTVAGAVRAVCRKLSPMYINVHAAGGAEMMRAAAQAARQESGGRTRVLAVTVLTSLDDAGLHAVGYRDDAAGSVLRMARLAQESGMDGVVCSAHEIEALRAACGEEFVLMVPGIRPAGSDAGDQKRIMTPQEAREKGATHLVIGRPITGAVSPEDAAREILASS